MENSHAPIEKLELRQQAEMRLSREIPQVFPDAMDQDINKIVRELQIHQIELEIQNEELRNANMLAENAMTRYYELYDFAPAGYITIGERGQIIDVNQAGLEVLNASKCFVTNNYLENYVADESLKIYRHFIANILGSKMKQNCEILLVRKNKEKKHVELHGILIQNSKVGQRELWISIFDITDRMKAAEIKEEARKQYEEETMHRLSEMAKFDKLKSEFFANQSHELRTPLNVILGSIQLMELKKNSLQAESGIKLDKYISTVKQNCFRLLRLINNIIDLTKLESNFSEINLANKDIVSIVEEITLSVAEYIETKGIFLQFDTDIEEKIIAYDEDKIERIMLNLLSNAVKFTSTGGEIIVNIFNGEEDIMISVRDTGSGIQRDKLDILFKRFHQVDMSLTREYEGSGIGLSLVKALVEMHGGTIEANSVYGKGSEFIIKLPVKLVPAEEQAQKDMGIKANQSTIERLNIEFSDIYLDVK